MYLHTITPQGAYTSLDLVTLPVWRLELAAMAIPSADPTKPMSGASLVALCIAYVANGTKSRAVIAAVDTKSPSDAIGIVDTGLPHMDQKLNRERIIESAKALYNNEELRKEAEEIIPKVGVLADIYHAILDAFGSVKAADGTFSQTYGPKVKGVLEGWQFALTSERFDAWRKAADTIRGIKQERAPERFDAPPPPAVKEAYAAGANGQVAELGGNPPPEGALHPKSRMSKEKARAERDEKIRRERAAREAERAAKDAAEDAEKAQEDAKDTQEDGDGAQDDAKDAPSDGELRERDADRKTKEAQRIYKEGGRLTKEQARLLREHDKAQEDESAEPEVLGPHKL